MVAQAVFYFMHHRASIYYLSTAKNKAEKSYVDDDDSHTTYCYDKSYVPGVLVPNDNG